MARARPPACCSNTSTSRPRMSRPRCAQRSHTADPFIHRRDCMRNLRTSLTMLLLAVAALPAMAQTLKSVKVEPAAPRPGETVTVTAQLELSENSNCGLYLHFG